MSYPGSGEDQKGRRDPLLSDCPPYGTQEDGGSDKKKRKPEKNDTESPYIPG